MSRTYELDPYGVKWMGAVPGIWSVEPTKRHYDIQLGKMLQNDPTSDTDRMVPYFKALHVLWGTINANDLPDMWAGPSEVRQYGVQNGDLLVCEGGKVGRAGIVSAAPVDSIIQNALHRVRAKTTGDVRFLMYVLHSVSSAGWFDVLCNRATIAHFTGEKFAALRIPSPLLDEQRAIASYLDRETARIDALIEKKQRQIEPLQEKRAALISHAVTKGLDSNVPMKDSGIEWLGKNPAHWEVPPLYARYSVELGKMLDAKRIIGNRLLPYLRNVDVQWDRVNVDNLPEMDIAPDEYTRFTLEEEDLLVCEGGEVGRTAIWRSELPVCAFQKAIHRVRPRSERDLPRFFYYVMRAAASSGIFLALGNPNTIPHLTAEKLRVYRFGFPPFEEQQRIVEYLEIETARIDAMTAKVGESIEKLHEYRTALISAAVTGKIDVRKEASHAV
ncbi:MAG: restriction endonuclease subunit S [Candidatus Zixiibacteriota bacterium]